MKYIQKLLTIAAVFSLIIFISCGGGGSDPEPDPQGKEKGELLVASAWVPTSVTNENTPRDEWANFSLSFTINTTTYDGGSFSVSNMPSETDATKVWPSSGGQWNFKASGDQLDLGTIVRSDGIEMAANITESSLTLSFTVPETSGRVEGFEGAWVFTFSH